MGSMTRKGRRSFWRNEGDLKSGKVIAFGADGHIKISDRKDFNTVIKAMCDYNKKGEVSGEL